MLIDVSSVQDQTFVTNYINNWVWLVETRTIAAGNNDLQFAAGLLLPVHEPAADVNHNALLHTGMCVVTECLTEKIVLCHLEVKCVHFSV